MIRITRIKVILFVVLFLGIGALYNQLSGNFSVRNFIPADKSPMAVYQNMSTEEIRAVLQQPYTFLSQGKQAHVFISADKAYVLKVFKPYFPSYPITILGKTYNLRFSKIPFAQTLYTYLFPKRGNERIQQDFQSYRNAIKLFSQETGLEYLHLHNRATFGDDFSVILTDKLGVSHKMYPDQTSFLIQKKVDLLYPTLAKYISLKEEEKAKKLIDSFVDISLSLAQKKICNPTTIEPNWGCIEDCCYLLDVGRLLTAEDLHEPPPSLEQVHHTAHHLKKWLQKNAPDLEDYLETSIQTHLSK